VLVLLFKYEFSGIGSQHLIGPRLDPGSPSTLFQKAVPVMFQ
jgi:hypothetical protein